LANLLLIIEAIPAAKKINVLTVYNFANALAIVVGSFIGGCLLTALGGGRHAYLMVFLASTIARCVALLILVKLPLRIPAFGPRKKTLPMQPVLKAPVAFARSTTKPIASTPRVHLAHPIVPKPAFLRISATKASEKDVSRRTELQSVASKTES
jgi:MFS family permease